jgi:TRAP-type mannitol/chloroaromatic compound transport system substrate-binding protein
VKRYKLLISLAAIFMALLLVNGCSNQEQKEEAATQKVKTTLLKVPVCFPTVLPGMGSTMPWVADRIETASGGTIKMKVYEPGKLVAPFEILDSVSTGKVNAGYSTPGTGQEKYRLHRFSPPYPSGLKQENIWHGCSMATV